MHKIVLTYGHKYVRYSSEIKDECEIDTSYIQKQSQNNVQEKKKLLIQAFGINIFLREGDLDEQYC